MKVCTLLVILMLFSLNAQSSGTDGSIINPVRWGIKGGANFAKMAGDQVNESEIDPKIGFTFGMFAEREINETVSVQWEFIYTMKGFEYSYSDNYSGSNYIEEYNSEQKINLNYIEIPVSFRFKFPTQAGFIPCFYAGGSVGFNVTAEIEYSVDYYEYYDDGSYSYEYTDSYSGSDDLENINELETGLVFGAAVKFPLENGSLLFDARYNYGLSSIISDGDANIFNRVWAVTLGYGF